MEAMASLTRRQRTLLAASVAALSALVVLTALRLFVPWFQSLDRAASVLAVSTRADGLVRVLVLLTETFDGTFMAVIVALLSAALWLSGHRRPACVLALSVALGTLSFFLLKLAFREARPHDSLLPLSTYSYPSGHATIGAVLFLFVAYLYGNAGQRHRMRAPFYALCAAMALAVGGSRVYLGVHWLSDVAAGLLLGVFCFTFAVLALEAAGPGKLKRHGN